MRGRVRRALEWAGALLALTVPFASALLNGRLGMTWAESVGFLAAFLLYFAVQGAFLLWAVESPFLQLARQPFGVIVIPMVGLGFGAPVIAALLLLQKGMQVSRPGTVAMALGVWICGCVLARRIRLWRRTRLADRSTGS